MFIYVSISLDNKIISNHSIKPIANDILIYNIYHNCCDNSIKIKRKHYK